MQIRRQQKLRKRWRVTEDLGRSVLSEVSSSRLNTYSSTQHYSRSQRLTRPTRGYFSCSCNYVRYRWSPVEYGRVTRRRAPEMVEGRWMTHRESSGNSGGSERNFVESLGNGGGWVTVSPRKLRKRWRVLLNRVLQLGPQTVQFTPIIAATASATSFVAVAVSTPFGRTILSCLMVKTYQGEA